MFPAFNIDTTGEEHLRVWTRHTQTGKLMRCFFCGNCGSRLMHSREGVASVSIRGGCLRDLSEEMLAGATHIWVKNAVVTIPAGAQTLDGEPSDG